jgi:hypothetical protein
MNPAVMRKQLQHCLETYYEVVLKNRGASGRPDASVCTRKFDEIREDAEAQLEEGESGDGDGVPAMPASADGAGAEDAGPVASAAAAAEAPLPKGKRGKSVVKICTFIYFDIPSYTAIYRHIL